MWNFLSCNMETKKYTIPLPTYLIKYLWYGYPQMWNQKAELVIKKRPMLFFRRSNHQHDAKYIDDPPSHTKPIAVRVRYLSKMARYYLIKSWEDAFRQRMCWYLEAHLSGELDAKNALREFFAIYDISDEDYNIESAYKYWKRYKTAKKKEKPLPLCPLA